MEKSRRALACGDRMPQAHFRYFQTCATSHVITKRGVCGGVRVRSHVIHDQVCYTLFGPNCFKKNNHTQHDSQSIA